MVCCDVGERILINVVRVAVIVVVLCRAKGFVRGGHLAPLIIFCLRTRLLSRFLRRLIDHCHFALGLIVDEVDLAD